MKISQKRHFAPDNGCMDILRTCQAREVHNGMMCAMADGITLFKTFKRWSRAVSTPLKIGTRRFHNALTTTLHCQSTLWANFLWSLLEQLGTPHDNIGLLIIYKRNANIHEALYTFEKYNIGIKECILFAL